MNCTERTGRTEEERKDTPFSPASLSSRLSFLPFPRSALQRRPFICCHSYRGAVHFFLLRSGSLLDLSLTPSSPYDWAVPLPEQSRATFKEPPPL